MIETAGLFLLFLGFAAFATKRSLTYMHIYQQEEYDSARFLRWIFKEGGFDKRLSFMLALCAGAALFIPEIAAQFVFFTAFVMSAYFEKDPRREAKKKLVLTRRAQRIFFPALALSIFSTLWCFFLPSFYGLWIVNVQLVPFFIVLVNAALQPYENKVQKVFWQEAHDKVLDYNPHIIAITGSFGKTSVKHILGHILKMHAPSLITPGSVNTPMGITRIIREELEPRHQYFIVEMGAYGPGSIARLCALTPPDTGVITAIGHAHYERFKSLETVAEAKYELAEAVLRKQDGLMIVNENTLRFDKAKALQQAHAKQFVVCGDAPESKAKDKKEKKEDIPGHLEVHKIVQELEGLLVRLSWKGASYDLKAPLYGTHHGHNLALAFVTAFELGLGPEDILSALKTLPQIAHRLEVKPQGRDMIVIDDAYNSNPIGFQSALGLLATLAQKSGGKIKRKILITPGMVELGPAHTEAHETIGRLAGQVCDVALVVNGQRIPSFLEGFKATGGQKELHEVASFAEAQSWVAANRQDGDAVLIENDLPDLYERKLRL